MYKILSSQRIITKYNIAMQYGTFTVEFQPNLINFRRRYSIVFSFVFYSACVETISAASNKTRNIICWHKLRINFRILWPTKYVRCRTRVLYGRRATRSVRSGTAEYRLLHEYVVQHLLQQLWVPDESVRKAKSRFSSRRIRKLTRLKQTHRIYCEYCLTTR